MWCATAVLLDQQSFSAIQTHGWLGIDSSRLPARPAVTSVSTDFASQQCGDTTLLWQAHKLAPRRYRALTYRTSQFNSVCVSLK
ncbi:hypothetical protein Pmani_023448 [Petrolisthes manimaculis]|uniref:Uncharacterized protein n=1 Tax=Petrolisthes manimaculis TaxID=1843537 RepID=A0AAE1PAK2_9EUCA|nr:hypothetical protein Pmani_023448 [Petrolisthes manimaculis]